MNEYGRKATSLFYVGTNETKLCLGKDKLKIHLSSIPWEKKKKKELSAVLKNVLAGQGLEDSASVNR